MTHDVGIPADRPAREDDVRVTPTMIEAGVHAILFDHEPLWEGNEALARVVYIAMERARLDSSDALGSAAERALSMPPRT